MKRIALIAAAAMVAAAAPNQTNHEGRAPHAYRADATVTVVFTRNVQRECEAIGLRGDHNMTKACSYTVGGKTTIIMPNPCPERGDYAKLMCHEIGHANGWPADHR